MTGGGLILDLEILSALLYCICSGGGEGETPSCRKPPVGFLTGRRCRVLGHALPCPWHGALDRRLSALRHSVLNIPGPSGNRAPSPARKNTPESGAT